MLANATCSEHVIIPRTENTIKCTFEVPVQGIKHQLTCKDINSELDELDREEFYRLKKVAGKKQRDVAAADAERKAKKAAEATKSDQDNVEPADDSGPTDMLAAGEDEDVIF